MPAPRAGVRRGAGPLVRQRLTAALTRAVVGAPITLLSAPTGLGKSALAATWAARTGPAVGTVAGLSLTTDNPRSVWTEVVAALHAAGMPMLPAPRRTPTGPPPAEFVTALANQLAAAAHPVVLIVDDADRLQPGNLADELGLLVQHTAGRLRLVLAGRADPPLPLRRYRAAGALAEIRGDQLAFTPAETRELLSRLGTPVTADAAEALAAATAGSPTALRLAAAQLARGVSVSRLLGDLDATDAAPAHHLADAVLAAQPIRLRTFVQRITFAEQLDLELVERLTEEPQPERLLAGLAAAHVFVEGTPDAPGGYRIPALLRELLAAQFAYDNPHEAAALRRLAAEWSTSSGAAGAASPGHVGLLVTARPAPARPGGRRAAAPRRPPQLSARQREVLRCLGDAHSTGQMAAELRMSTNTVRGHVRNLTRKLAATGRDDAVRRALELKLM